MHLVVIFGPPAVGKMAVGHELAKLTDFKLFHNHMTVEPVLDIFPFGSAPFVRLVAEFRRRVVEEAVAADLGGMVFTYVWALDDPDDKRGIDRLADIVRQAGGRVDFVELYADQGARLSREGTDLRMAMKRHKRNPEEARALLLELDESYRMNTDESFPADGLFGDSGYVRIDNTDLSAEATTQLIIKEFDLPRG